MGHPVGPAEHSARLPEWLRKTRDLKSLHVLKKRLRCAGLSTVCEEARCPNISECFGAPTATFLILGDRCTRDCMFCSVANGTPSPPDPDEPARIASAVSELGLTHAVVTSVTRDDLPDHGAGVFAATIRAIRDAVPGCTVEVLTPDFCGKQDPLETVLAEKPDVFGHNVETVRRLQGTLRPRADMTRSLALLKTAKGVSQDIVVKSGFMVGLGESEEEIKELLLSLVDAQCDVVTIGQYLRPTRHQVPVRKYWEPGAYERWSNLARSLGIVYCVAGPFVRSSYRAGEVLDAMRSVRREQACLLNKEIPWTRFR